MAKKSPINLILAVSLLLSTFCFGTPAQSASVTAIRCGKLINPKDGSIVQNAVIIVSGDRIEQVGAGLTIPAGAKLIDLSAYTVLPGLIDCHTHVMLQPEDERG